MAPVILALKREPWVEVRVLATAQHRQILDQILDLFAIRPDIDLDIMQPNQTLPELTARLLVALDQSLAVERPHVVLAQGDTTSVLASAMAAFYRRVPFGHVEAGLRTGDLQNPFPEEMNRAVAGRLSRWHFAPTESARQNLLREGIPDPDIYVTGNTVIDALLDVAQRGVQSEIDTNSGKRLILVTAHRRENFGEPFLRICQSILTLAENNSDVEILYPVHPNPNVSEVARRILGQHPRIRLCAPLEYAPFVAAMKRSYLILTDSGGVQEEAPALGKPVLVLRAETERPEALAQGVVKLVGTDTKRIVAETQELLDSDSAYRNMSRGISPYGDGQAARRIVEILRHSVPVAAPEA